MANSGHAGGVGTREGKAAAWRRRMAQWQSSGMSQSGYCRRQGLALSTFQYWRKRVGEAAGRDGAAGNGSAFIPVDVKESSALVAPLPFDLWACEVVAPGGVRVRLRKRPGLAGLRRVVAVLAGLEG